LIRSTEEATVRITRGVNLIKFSFVADAGAKKARVFVFKLSLMFSSKAGVHLSGAPSGVYV